MHEVMVMHRNVIVIQSLIKWQLFTNFVALFNFVSD